MGELILIVDDERDLVDTLDYNFKAEGYQTRLAYSATQAIEAAEQSPLPNLIVLDLMLPDGTGTEVCRQLRMNEITRHIPVMILTAKGEEIDRVVGFEVGADDYVVKPFSVREVALRVRAILRRHQQSATASPEETCLSFGLLRADPDSHRAWVAQQELTLTALEFKLLTTLLSRRGRVQTRERLLDDVWGIQAEVTTRTVDTHVKRVRQKLGAAGHYIETLRGVGYRFREHPDESPHMTGCQ